jgi:hypothetical protein
MSTEWGRLTRENQQYINEKAKTKKDGVYSARGIIYRVKNNRATHYASRGEILGSAGAFNYACGKYDSTDEAKKLLIKLKEGE